MYRLTFGEFLIVTALAAAAKHAGLAPPDPPGNKQPTPRGGATGHAARNPRPLYFIRYWLRKRRSN